MLCCMSGKCKNIPEQQKARLSTAGTVRVTGKAALKTAQLVDMTALNTMLQESVCTALHARGGFSIQAKAERFARDLQRHCLTPPL